MDGDGDKVSSNAPVRDGQDTFAIAADYELEPDVETSIIDRYGTAVRVTQSQIAGLGA